MATATNSLTAGIVNYLNLSGFVAWRNNSNAVYSVKQKVFRKNPSMKLGVPDIIGYKKNDGGKIILIEVKTGRDKLSEHQQRFIAEAQRHGCICFVAHDFDEFLAEIKKYG